MSKTKQYDVIVIGSGGGTKLATPVARLGKRVAVIEKDKWGGTCLNRGCIPSKMLIHPANVARHAQDSSALNLDLKFKGVDFAGLTSRLKRETAKDSRSIPPFYDTVKGLDWYHGEAKFVAERVVEVNGKRLTGKRIFIATGSRPFVPPIAGLKGTPYMTSTQALFAKKLPRKLLVIGGGYIACELGHAYGALGSDVTLLVRGRTLLGREDSEVQKEFVKGFTRHYNVRWDVDTQKVTYSKGKFTLTLKEKNGKVSKISGDGLLVATGVRPNTDMLGLENTSIGLSKRGFVRVNRFMETSVIGVYALGDCVGNYMFRHSVNFEGEFLFRSLFVEKKRQAIRYPPMPHAVFSYPEIGAVGKSENEIVAAGLEYVKGVHSYKKSAQGMARRSEVGFVKVLVDRKSRRLLGAHIVGDEASIMVHQLILAMQMRVKIDDLLSMIYIHPALNEVVRNACRNALKGF